MRLFYRSFYSFVFLITFQALLTGVLVISITDRNNREDARRELEQKAALSYDAVNGWVRSLWQELIRIQTEGVAAITDAPFSARGLLLLEERYGDRLFAAGFDYFVIRQSPMAWSRTVVNPTHQLAPLAPQILILDTDHPAIRYYRDGEVAAMVGGLHLYAEDERRLDLFVAKCLDDGFCRTLASRSGSEIFLSTPGKVIGASVRLPDITGLLSLGSMERSYREWEPLLIGEERYRAAVRRLGGAKPAAESIYVTTLVSDSRYAARIRLIARTAIAVSAFAALLSLLVSLLLSRYLSRPAQLLLTGMRKVKHGILETQLETTPSKEEFGVLFRGFNSMAAELQEDRKRMDRYIAEITRLKEYNEAIIHSIKAGIAIIGKELRVETANPSFDAFVGDTVGTRESEGREIAALELPFVDEETVRRIGEVVHRERRSYSKRCRSVTDRVYELKLYPLSPASRGPEREGCVLLVEDITDRDALESKMYQAEKIASLGLLSAGVAHEINNPLSSITTNVQNLISVNEDREQSVALELIESETRRIAGIVRNLLDFATAPGSRDSSCDVAEVVRGTTGLVRAALRREREVDIRIGTCDRLPLVAIDKEALGQVLMNLLLNAVQAVDGNGAVTIRSEPRDGGVRLRVSDNGCGIPEAYRSRIFDPFFTTKMNGDGTGLGLSVVYGIVTEYGGTVQVESVEGDGTTVELQLPGVAGEGVAYA